MRVAVTIRQMPAGGLQPAHSPWSIRSCSFGEGVGCLVATGTPAPGRALTPSLVQCARQVGQAGYALRCPSIISQTATFALCDSCFCLANFGGADFAWIRIGAARPHNAAGILESCFVSVVVPDVPRMSPVSVRPRVPPTSRVNLHVAMRFQPVGSERVDVTCRIAQGPVSQLDRMARVVMQVNPFSVQTGIRTSV